MSVDVGRRGDPHLDARPPERLAALGAIWHERAGLELQVGAAFATVFRELVEAGADEVVLSLCSRAVADEVRHARLCLSLAERLLGRPLPWPGGAPCFVPTYPGFEGSLLAAAHVAALCGFNETIATVRLSATLGPTKSEATRLVLKQILEDEVDHARIGWAHLSSRHVSPAMRARLAPLLPALAEASLSGVLDENAAVPDDGDEDGLPSVATTRAVTLAAIDDVVIPGFDHVGVDTTALRAWRSAQ